ncbi:MAG: metallophosphoesterase [bacterium]
MENSFTRRYYLFSAFWLGLLVNLLLAAILIWFAAYILKNTTIPKLASLLFSFAILISFYGLWNALNPQIKSIDVKIKNLPVEWRGKQIVQLSDVHLGHIYRENFLQNLVDQINLINPKAVFITGDLFDGMDGRLEKLVEPLNNLKTQSYLITGNHETYLGIEKSFSTLKRTPIKILNNEMVDIDGLQVIGISYPSRSEKKDITSKILAISNFSPKKSSILLYHSPTFLKEAQNLGINLQLSGHTHKGQIFPFGFITSWIYHGYDHGLYTFSDYNLYVSNGVGTWGPPMRIGNIPEIVVITLR